MSAPLRWMGQAIAYAAFAVFVGYFSDTPAYVHLDPGDALIKLSFSHSGERLVECRKLTYEEISRLPPSERRPQEACPRERVPLLVELEINGQLIYRELLPPAGFARDGESTVYERFTVSAGRHHVLARLRDSTREQGFDYVHEEMIELEPGQNFVVDFREETGGFVFR
jgi:hypothetical protein